MPAPVFDTVLRLRCPHCGRAGAFKSVFEVHETCRVCGYKLKRGNPEYFSGAIIINFLLGAGGTLAMMLLVIVLTWPAVPWQLLGYLVPAAMILSVMMFNPISKAILMAVDVRMRAVTEDELMAGSHEESRIQARQR